MNQSTTPHIEDETSINQRLNFLVEAFEKGKKASFARKIGVSAQAVQEMLTGRKSDPSFRVLVKILEEYPYVSSEWLVLGHGRMLRDSPVALEAELALLAQEYIQLSKQLEDKKATYREAASDLAQLRAEVQHHEAALQVQMNHLPNFDLKAQELMRVIIRQQEEALQHARERYTAFLPLHEQAEASLLKTHKQQTEVEAKINDIVLPD